MVLKTKGRSKVIRQDWSAQAIWSTVVGNSLILMGCFCESAKTMPWLLLATSFNVSAVLLNCETIRCVSIKKDCCLVDPALNKKNIVGLVVDAVFSTAARAPSIDFFSSGLMVDRG
ncbi:MAG: hypothetical protein A2103_00580 [Gammaproteobacteria bacterium GWF2_41_13]|nr:MAG: hypothetical protein A2103_00580 [Gammaproteobacteria bacterium GWF2_41_13]